MRMLKLMYPISRMVVSDASYMTSRAIKRQSSMKARSDASLCHWIEMQFYHQNHWPMSFWKCTRATMTLTSNKSKNRCESFPINLRTCQAFHQTFKWLVNRWAFIDWKKWSMEVSYLDCIFQTFQNCFCCCCNEMFYFAVVKRSADPRDRKEFTEFSGNYVTYEIDMSSLYGKK